MVNLVILTLSESKSVPIFLLVVVEVPIRLGHERSVLKLLLAPAIGWHARCLLMGLLGVAWMLVVLHLLQLHWHSAAVPTLVDT